MKLDINNPKYPVGTKFRLTRDYCGHTVANSYKKGTYFVIESFGPGVFQPKDGFHSYFFRQCSKNGKLFKRNNGWSQQSIEQDLHGNLFEVVEK